MLLGFKARFEPYVIEGSKTHTIRRVKRYPPKVGETCHCYGDVRQRSQHLLGRWPCTAIDDIVIKPVLSKPSGYMVTLKVFLNGEELSADETEALFFRDGFRPHAELNFSSTKVAAHFWKDNFKTGEPFVGQMIHWDFARPVTQWKGRK